MSQKSILEQALLQVQTLEEAVKQNAKGILASTMKQELSDLLKESLEEEEEVNPDEEETTPKEEETEDMPDEDSGDETDLDNEPNKDIDSMDSADDDVKTDDEMDSVDTDSDDMSSGDDDVMDMTGASHDEVLKVFKAMKPEDGIIVKKDGDEIDFNTGDDEYIIKLDDESSEHEMSEENWSMEEDETEVDANSEELSEEENDETIYEIDLDDMSDSSEESLPGDETSIEGDVEEGHFETEDGEGEFKESARTMGNGYHGGLDSKKKYFAGNKRDINEEVSKLRKQNAEYKKALILFKEKLNEVAVFNANLAYATRLFTENSTTKQEKLNILKRFDSVSTMNESKNLFKTINNELENKKPITESVVEKISTTKSTSSTEVLSEAKAYENPQFKRMKDLMSKIK